MPMGAAAYVLRERAHHLVVVQVAEIWRDYFVFTVVRDPYNRAVSQYRHCFHRNLAVPAECAALVSRAGRALQLR